MPVVITPVYPVYGETVTLAVDNLTGNMAGYYVNASPERSVQQAGFLNRRLDGGDRIDTPTDDEPYDPGADITKLQEMLDSDALTDSFVPDASGEYEFTAYELRKVRGIPSYPGDPAGEIVQDLVIAQSNSVWVGEYMDLPLVTADGDGADLRLQVNDATVRAATLVNHRTNSAAVASAQTAVTNALAACIGIPAGTIGADLLAAVNDLRAKAVLHFAEGPNVHVAADATNVINRSGATDEQGAITLLNEVRENYVAHALDSPAVGSPGAWHYNTTDDLENLPLAAAATSIADATVLCADLRLRGYARHRLTVNPGTPPICHDALSGAPTALAVAATDLDNVVVAFFDALISTGNSAQDNENQGEVTLRSTFGFSRV